MKFVRFIEEVIFLFLVFAIALCIPAKADELVKLGKDNIVIAHKNASISAPLVLTDLYTLFKKYDLLGGGQSQKSIATDGKNALQVSYVAQMMGYVVNVHGEVKSETITCSTPHDGVQFTINLSKTEGWVYDRIREIYFRVCLEEKSQDEVKVTVDSAFLAGHEYTWKNKFQINFLIESEAEKFLRTLKDLSNEKRPQVVSSSD